MLRSCVKTVLKGCLSQQGLSPLGELDGDKLQLKGAITDTKSVMEQILTVWQRAWSGGIGGEFAGLDDLARLLEDVRGGKDAAEKLRKAAMLGQTVRRSQPRFASA